MPESGRIGAKSVLRIAVRFYDTSLGVIIMSGNWKDLLLRTGLPLEATVARVLTDCECHVLGEYEYTTISEDGSPLVVHAMC